MGTLTSGFYTRGSKTSLQISQLTGMTFQDTVFNTDTQQRLVYDGSYWVAGNQISVDFYQAEVPSADNVTISGAIVFPAPYSDNNSNLYPLVKASVPNNGDQNLNMVGVVQGNGQNAKMVTQSSKQIVQYSGMSYILYEGYTGTFSFIQGTFINKSNAPAGTPPSFLDFMPNYGRAGGGSTIGNAGVWTTVPTSQTLSFYIPAEGVFATAYFTRGLGTISLLETN